MLTVKIASDDAGFYFDQDISNGAIIGFAVFVALLYIGFYLLRSFGLYKIAKNRGINKAYLSFIPGVWMFVACKIIGNTNVFGINADKAAVWLTVIFSCAVYLPLISNFLEYFPFAMYYLQGGNIQIISDSTGTYFATGNDFVNLFDTTAINVIIKIIAYAGIFFRLAEIFILITVYIALFKMYWPEHYILGAVLSFFGLFPIIVFAVRNRNAVDFNEYFRQRYYGAGNTPYGGNGYGSSDGQNRNYYGAQNGNPYNNQAENNDPFGEFSNRPEEPFGEFSDKNDKKDDNGNDDFFS